MGKRVLTSALSVLVILTGIFTMSGSHITAQAKSDIIDNSGLIPKYVQDEQVTIEDDGSPDWVKTLIMAEVHIQTATKEGTLKSAVKVLDHYSEMGVNGLWITPVYDPGGNGNGYGNLGPHTIDPAITGTTDYAKGWKVLEEFINEAHKRNIRIILDVISWGTVLNSPLKEQHPDWYNTEILYGGNAFEWSNEEFKAWYIEQIVNIGLNTGCDGFRYDVEPRYASYDVHEKIRTKLLNKGRKLVYISEDANERSNSYTFEQFGVRDAWNNYTRKNPTYSFLENLNIVDCIKNGKNIGSEYSESMEEGAGYRFYTNGLCSHDNQYTVVNRNRLAIGYQEIFSPFIPLWYIGEEWNNPREVDLSKKGGCLYFGKIDWEELNQKENREFYEDVKAMIKIRRQYFNIFEYYPSVFRETNICKVNVKGCVDLQSYARFKDDTALIVVPNYNINNKNADMTVYVPFKNIGIDYYKNYVVSDAETGKVIVSGPASKVAKFTVKVPYEDQRVFVIKATGRIIKTDSSISIKDSEIADLNNVGYDDETPYFDDNQDTNQTAEQDDGKKYLKKVIKRHYNNSESNAWLIILSIAGGTIFVAGGTVITIILVKKHKHKLKN